MNRTTDPAPSADTERRRSFRLKDRVVLAIHQISRARYPELLEEFNARRRSVGIATDFMHAQEGLRPVLKEIERSDPLIAQYLEQLDAKITCLAAEMDRLPRSPKQHHSGEPSTMMVNLSAHGLRARSQRYYDPDEILELTLQLLPSRVRMLVYARVIWCAKVEGVSDAQRYHVGLEFDHIHPEDREVLARHIAARQLNTLQASPTTDHSDGHGT